MKKAIFVLLVFSLSVSVFARDFPLSVGAGNLFGYTFTRYTIKGNRYHDPGVNIRSTQDMDRFNYGGFLFFDAKYAVVSVILQGGKNSYKENIFNGTSLLEELSGAGTGTEMSLGFSLLGKYPFKINERMTWFPMLGIEYHIALIQKRRGDYFNGDDFVYGEYDRSKGVAFADLDKNGNSYPLSAWNAWWINIGAGLDYSLTESWFLRGEFLFGIRLPTKYEMGSLDMIKDKRDDAAVRLTNEKMGGLTGSPTFKISVGYRF